MTAEQVRSPMARHAATAGAGVLALVGSAVPAIAANTHGDVDLFVHVRVLISIILGLTIARLVEGLAEFIQHRRRVSLIHLGWVAWALFNAVTLWWWEFGLHLVEHWSFGLYLFICVYVSMYYVLAVILFPDELEEYQRYFEYFVSRRVWFFGFVALTEALDVVDTWIKGTEYLQSLGSEYFIRLGGFIALCLVAAMTRNRTFHAVFVVVALLYEISYFTRYYFTLS